MSKTPFQKLLIANRGEIAVRIMKTARAMGLTTVAVHSDVDADAEHVRAADEAVCIGGNAPVDSYLRVDRVIAAAKATGAGAIHPGYGFLSENPALPLACAEAGLVFVGPSAASIEQMGDKAAAKALMIAAGVPCVPGYDGADQSPDALKAEAEKIGFPLMIKATAGGGGRGMRLVTDVDAFDESLKSAVSEAQNAFGNGAVLLERAIQNPRHVEVQIMADRHGNVIHLGERDCSVQRRHQKLIEEAPSPAVTADLREKMGGISINAARAIGYHGAGTFEYLLDEDGHFYFMEMNTRLQVEHPVTEAITGLDLVELQLRVAAGEALPLKQADVQFCGHAIEVRLCAEDPEADFLPQSGVMDIWRPSPDLRTDHGLRDGAEVSPFYDSMMAKLIAHGPDRDAALNRLRKDLGQTLALGVTSNSGFLSKCLSHPVFVDGDATTGFIETYRQDLMPEQDPEEARALALAAAFLRAGETTGLAHGFPTPLRLARNRHTHEIAVQALALGRCQVKLAEDTTDVTVRSRSGERIVFSEGNRTETAYFRVSGGTIWLHFNGRPWAFQDMSFAPEISADAVSDGRLRASMNGTVVSVTVAPGDTVTAGQPLMVLEAMKMEHAHTTPVGGTVSVVHVAPGAQVTAHTVLIEVTPDEGTA